MRVAADVHVVLGVARVDEELRRRPSRPARSTNSGFEAHEVALDLLPCPAEELEGPRLVELHADLGDEALPAAFDELERLGRERLVPRHAVGEHPAIIQLRL